VFDGLLLGLEWAPLMPLLAATLLDGGELLESVLLQAVGRSIPDDVLEGRDSPYYSRYLH
jgi:hypothetical protein